jgi:NAD(P)-dependent dehydrogenase (short-subunit alcohol dehydrogenase family)
LVKQLLADGHTVVATARGPSTALSLLAEATPDGLAILNCDLASAESIKVFGIELAKRVSRIDVLINNAGKSLLYSHFIITCGEIHVGMEQADLRRSRNLYIARKRKFI